MPHSVSFDSVVFSGGGNRCTWQAGWWDRVAPEIGLQPRMVAGVSAGAAMACLILADRTQQALSHYRRVLAANPRNFYAAELLRGRRPFPHYGIYRQALLSLLDQAAMDRLRRGPRLRVLLARPPAWSGSWGGVVLGLACYTIERHLCNHLHPVLTRRAGFRPLVARAEDCRSPQELADLILASSCTPPILPRMSWQGKPVLDGGLVDNVPLAALGPKAGRTLVLLSRPYKPGALPKDPEIVYMQPSAPVPVAKWDYTSWQRIHRAYEMGRLDGERYLRQGRRVADP